MKLVLALSILALSSVPAVAQPAAPSPYPALTAEELATINANKATAYRAGLQVAQDQAIQAQAMLQVAVDEMVRLRAQLAQAQKTCPAPKGAPTPAK